MYELRVKLEFAAAHHLEGYPGDCARPHGHNWELEVFARSQGLDSIGIAVDFRELKGAVRELIGRWDHQDLNLVEDFRNLNPSAEQLAKFAYDWLSSRLDRPKDARRGERLLWIDRVTIWENRSCSATYLPVTMLKPLILMSGGLDSSACLALAADAGLDCTVLNVNYGQRAAGPERTASQKFAEYYGARFERVDLPWLGELGGSALTDVNQIIPDLGAESLDDLTRARETARAVWVPNRNGVLISVAAAVAERQGCDAVVMGFNREEAQTFPDNSEAFMEATCRALEFSTQGRVKVASPTVRWNKVEIVNELRKLKRKFPFDLVWSCYTAGPRACGRCESCRRLERAVAG